MDDAKGLIEAYVPTAFLWAVLVVIGGILLSFGVAFAGGLFSIALADSLAGVWLGAGLLVFAIAFYVFYWLVQELRTQAAHRRTIEQTRADALLIETKRQFAPAPRPAETLAVTTGIEIVMVGNLIDKRDLFYFCQQIAVTKDWTARKWEGITLPHGYKITNKDTGGIGEKTSYAKLMALFTDCKPPLIPDRREGVTGKDLTETDPRRMVARIIGNGV